VVGLGQALCQDMRGTASNTFFAFVSLLIIKYCSGLVVKNDLKQEGNLATPRRNVWREGYGYVVL
jgi:hypothetical protein